MLNYPIERCRLGTARGVFIRRSRLAAFSHEAIVVSGSCQDQETEGIEFPRHNGSAPDWRKGVKSVRALKRRVKDKQSTELIDDIMDMV